MKILQFDNVSKVFYTQTQQTTAVEKLSFDYDIIVDNTCAQKVAGN